MLHLSWPIRPLTALAAVAAGLLLCGVSQGATVNEDFESQPVSDPSALTSLPVAGGVGTLTISDPTDPQAFGIQNLAALQIKGSAPLGSRSVQPDLYDDPTPLNVNFFQPVTSFSLDFADASDQVDQLSLKAFSGPNGTGSVLATQTGTLTSALDQFVIQTLTVSGTGIGSVQFVGGPAGTDQAFYDNFRVTTSGVVAVPLPTAAKVFPLGIACAVLGGWILSRRTRRSTP